MRQPGGRHELKHHINHTDFMELRARLPMVMRRDRFTDAQGGYQVSSLYFDNYNDKALREKIDGVDQREKFRLRFYNHETSMIRLEKKSKRSGISFKQSAIIPHDTCTRLLAGDYDALKQTGDPLHLELYAKIRHEGLRPKNIVAYRREAFVFSAGNVRVTLDDQIRFCSNPSVFLSPRHVSIPLPGLIILEVKYDHFLPELIRGVTTLSSRQITAFSKYAAARII